MGEGSDGGMGEGRGRLSRMPATGMHTYRMYAVYLHAYILVSASVVHRLLRLSRTRRRWHLTGGVLPGARRGGDPPHSYFR